MAALVEEVYLEGAEGFDSDELGGSKSASQKQKLEEKNAVDESESNKDLDGDRKGDENDGDDSSDFTGCEHEIYENDSDYETEEIKRQFYLYNERLNKSGGFDVDPEIIPRVDHFGGVRPVNMIWRFGQQMGEDCLEFAIKEHNNGNEKSNLELVHFKKANVGPTCGRVYYITFEAKDSRGPKTLVRTYQCEAVCGARDPDEEFGIYINFLRLKAEEKVG